MISHRDILFRDDINQPNEHSWFINTRKAEKQGVKEVVVLFNAWWMQRIHRTNTIKGVNFTFHIRENLSKQEICYIWNNLL